MEVMGWAATIVIVGAVAAGVVIGVRSIPDIQRYLRMRRISR